MNSNIKLSIVIPTLNSESVLTDTLSTLMPQVVGVESLEVVIINNGSIDKTQSVINKFKDKYPSIKCITRESTIPARDNFKDGVYRASGEYVLLLGDDDVVSPSFISIIMPLLKRGCGLIHYNRVLGLNNLTNNTQMFRNIDFEGCIYYENYDDFLKEYNFEFNFMSSVIFKKEVWIKGEGLVSFEKPYYGYHWYANLVYGAIGTPCIYYSYPLIIQRERNKTWGKVWPLYWIVGMFTIYKDLDAFVPGIYYDFYKKQHDERKDYFLSLFAGIAKNKSYYLGYKKEFYDILSPNERRLFNVILVVPSFLGIICQKLYRIIQF